MITKGIHWINHYQLLPFAYLYFRTKIYALCQERRYAVP